MARSASNLEDLAARAIDGDRAALTQLVEALQDPVYGLCLRMLGDPEDARDATQEILIRVVTRLSSFRGDSALRTWTYRIAANYLVDLERRPRERITFEQLDTLIGQGREPIDPASLAPAPAELLAEEVFVGCSLAVLRCIDRDHRLAFILGGVLELDSGQAAAILGLEPATYRKRLSRARQRLEAFLRPRCGVMNPDAACRCANQVELNVQRGLIEPRRLALVGPGDLSRARDQVRQLRRAIDAIELYRRHPEIHAPEDMAEWLRTMLAESGPGHLH